MAFRIRNGAAQGGGALAICAARVTKSTDDCWSFAHL